MKRKIFSIFLALVLVCSFSLVTAVPAAAATLNVPDPYPTIQEAINAAGPDDTISVAAGTYVGDLTIPAGKENLELVGATGATIKGVQVLEWAFHAPAISVSATGVKIHGFTIESPDYSGALGNPHSSGIAVGAANVEIYDNTFVSTDVNNTLYWCTSIETYGAWQGDVSGLNIHDNTFTSTTGTDKGSEGIYINYNPDIPDPVGTVTIANNTFGGEIFRAITTERSKTTISGNTITSSYAPFVDGSPYSAALRGIDVSSTMANLNPNQDTVVMTGNSVTGFYWGFCLGATGNDLMTNISLNQNTVETNTVGIKVRSSAGGVVVNNNSIIGNTLYGVDNADTTAVLNATGNWWGTAIGSEIAAMVSGDVTFTDWLLQAPTWVEMTATSSPATAPTVATSAASDVAFTLATLNGDLTSMGTADSVDVSFGYDIVSRVVDPSLYANWTTLVPVIDIGAFSAELTSLTPGETYYFMARAKGDDVTEMAYGGFEFSFTTAAITTLDATDIGAYTATLNGHLEIGDAEPVTLSFEYDSLTAPATPSLMTTSGEFSADLTGLTLGQTYTFQALGDIGGDIGYGGDMSFITAPRIGISVSPTFVDFGDIIAGHSSTSKPVTVTNEGDFNEIFTTTATNESPALFYTDNLVIDTVTVASWLTPEVLPTGSVIPELVLSIPIGEAAGAKTATLIFWAEAGLLP